MTTLGWGAGGTVRSTFTGGVNNGWYTPGLSVPDARAIYDGTRPIEVASIASTVGAGDRRAFYAIGSSGWRTSGFHLIATSSLFSFLVQRVSGTIQLGLAASAGYTTYWFDSGQPVNWSPNGVQPGQMVWYESPSAPTTTVAPNNSVAGRVDITVSAPSSNGGRTISTYTHQISRNASFTDIVAEWESPASNVARTGLPTGVPLYHRCMAQNAVTDGVGKKGGVASTTKSFSLGTAPVDAPTFTVAPAASGISATVTLAPPLDNGGSIITNYDVQYEYLSPPPIPGSPTVTFNTTTSPVVVNPLVPGASYRWRSRANNAIGPGPYGTWITVLQPKPNLDPGQYFDGNTTDTPDTNFTWASTANNSISYATMPGANGWAISFTTGNGFLTRALGGAAVPYGFAGSYSALVTVIKDTTAAGLRAGVTTKIPVVAGQEYFGSIYSLLERSQRVAAEITWWNAANGIISRAVGTAAAQPAGLVGGLWPRSVVQATAPAGAVNATVVLIDVAGTGYSPWLSGQRFRVDAAMLSLGELTAYFDGATPNTTDFRYNWDGAANASRSYRTNAPQATIDLLADPNCPPIPSAPLPPSIVSSCIDETGVWSRYWVYVPETEISEWLAEVPTLRVQTAGFEAHQIRIRTYENPDDLLPEDFDATQGFASEQIVSYLPANTTLTLDSVSERAWADIQGQRVVADQLIYGSEGTPPTWPIFSCGISYLISVDTPVNVGVLLDLTLTRRQ